jgi:hypothetical protein
MMSNKQKYRKIKKEREGNIKEYKETNKKKNYEKQYNK